MPDAHCVASIDEVAAADWNALDTRGVPFLRHEFLAALEHGGCVGAGTGWQPCYLIVPGPPGGPQLLGAVPLFEKRHSYGEFVFDFAWAEAYARHGAHYYPKLVAATPFTPATGPRLLLHPAAPAAATRESLRLGLEQAAHARGASSVHVQFPLADESAQLAGAGWLPRIDCQFHWHNAQYADFEAFLATFTAEKRKKVRRERRRVQEAGIGFEWCAGAALDRRVWREVHALHAATFHRHGHEPYLTLAFFEELSRTLPGQPVVALARHGASLVAAAICFTSADTLYGRYWGGGAQYHSLHFETCYYQGIDYAIRRGLQRFEPGAQGEHKLARGFRPVLTHSAHHVRDARFAAAIARYLGQEREAMQHYCEAAGEHLPYREAGRPERALELP
jgi:predicted N-acyltransferase